MQTKEKGGETYIKAITEDLFAFLLSMGEVKDHAVLKLLIHVSPAHAHFFFTEGVFQRVIVGNPFP